MEKELVRRRDKEILAKKEIWKLENKKKRMIQEEIMRKDALEIELGNVIIERNGSC